MVEKEGGGWGEEEGKGDFFLLPSHARPRTPEALSLLIENHSVLQQQANEILHVYVKKMDQLEEALAPNGVEACCEAHCTARQMRDALSSVQKRKMEKEVEVCGLKFVEIVQRNFNMAGFVKLRVVDAEKQAALAEQLVAMARSLYDEQVPEEDLGRGKSTAQSAEKRRGVGDEGEPPSPEEEPEAGGLCIITDAKGSENMASGDGGYPAAAVERDRGGEGREITHEKRSGSLDRGDKGYPAGGERGRGADGREISHDKWSGNLDRHKDKGLPAGGEVGRDGEGQESPPRLSKKRGRSKSEKEQPRYCPMWNPAAKGKRKFVVLTDARWKGHDVATELWRGICRLSDRILKPLLELMQLEEGKPAVIMTEQGAGVQGSHYDYNPKLAVAMPHLVEVAIPFSCWSALERARIRVYPGWISDHAPDATFLDVDVEPGEMLLFVGTLAHTGLETGLRAHLYTKGCASGGMKDPADHVFPVENFHVPSSQEGLTNPHSTADTTVVYMECKYD